MKLNVTIQKPPFRPVDVTLTCETQEELDFIGALFNKCWFTNNLQKRGLNVTWPYEVLQSAGADVQRFSKNWNLDHLN